MIEKRIVKKYKLCIKFMISLIILYLLGFFVLYEKKIFEFNLNGESNQVYWLRDCRSWVPSVIEPFIDYIYQPMMHCGMQGGVGK